MTVTSNIEILMVDPEALVRESIARVINASFEGFQVTDQVEEFDAAMKIVEDKHRGIKSETTRHMLIIDVALPGRSGIELLHEMRRRRLYPKSLVLSSLESPDLVANALLAGCDGYILKSSGIEELKDGLEVAATTDRKYLPSKILAMGRIPENFYSLNEGQQQGPDPLAGISNREREIFHLLANGLTNTAIAKSFLSVQGQ